ncbi:hypothetical protein [Clostridium sp. YIM B02555]|uniref:hypothetical protein n=1 Tax=Clostridium sp. YIM B02555 TaxID=2911968 RepID=UPI001EEE8684|nr:hypothetical protein [Clostridium sp. YIM B02555]
MENLWFNEDDDRVSGYKACFESKEDFIKAANKLHVEQTGYGCIVDEVECNVCLITEDTLKGESIYLLEESGAEIATLYYADCESLESYDLKDGNGTVKLNDGTVVDLKGEIIESPRSEVER